MQQFYLAETSCGVTRVAKAQHFALHISRATLSVGILLLGVIALGIFTATPARAQEAQATLDSILHEFKPEEVSAMRAACVTGHEPKLTADARAAGFERADASVWCVTVLTRQGRDGTLGYLRDPASDKVTPAVSFDSGFVGGFLKHAPVPEGAPTMATLLQIAERCVEQREATGLCNATGQMIGLRVVHGETVKMH